MKDLKGKVAVITGGGSPRGIGHATGALLAKQGMKVVLDRVAMLAAPVLAGALAMIAWQWPFFLFALAAILYALVGSGRLAF